MRSIEVGVGAYSLLEDGRGCDVGGKSQSHKKQVASISRINHWIHNGLTEYTSRNLKSTEKKKITSSLKSVWNRAWMPEGYNQ